MNFIQLLRAKFGRWGFIVSFFLVSVFWFSLAGALSKNQSDEISGACFIGAFLCIFLSFQLAKRIKIKGKE